MRITRIESQQRRPGRQNIYADGVFLAAASTETILRLGLRTGDTVGPDLLESIRRTDSLLRTRGAALRLLAVRPRTVRELRDRLARKSCPPDEIDAVVDDLERTSLLDDRAFARAYIRDHLALRASGPALLRARLLRLGLPPAILDEALGEEVREADQEALALRAAREYLKRRRPARGDEAGTRRRLGAHLARRGFSWETVARTVRQVMSDESGESNA